MTEQREATRRNSNLPIAMTVRKAFSGYTKEIKTRSINLPTWLLVLFAIATGMSVELAYNITFGITTKPEASSCWAPLPGSDTSAVYIEPTLQNSIICLLFPFTGWLADTKLGRERAIHLSLWSCWLGTLLQVISYCIQYGTCGLPVNIAKYGISGIALLLLMFGTSSFFPNIPAYGLDQLYEKPNTTIRAFIHWISWGWFVGFGVSFIAFVHQTIYDAKLLLITGLVILLVNSIALCLYAWLNYKFEPSGVLKKNPYKMVYQVLKYAWKHKSPENRSALTYWENKTPSRISLGKQKYGGPFKEMEVEDVKTFWRVMRILLCLFGLYIPFFPGVLGTIQYINSFEGATTSINGYGSYVLWTSFDELLIIIVPLLELLVIPLFPKVEYFFLNPLRGMIALYLLLLMSLVSMITIETLGHYLTPETVPCLSSLSLLNMSFLYYAIPLLFGGIISGLSFIFGLEFVLSQAPCNMSGMLTGAFWLIRATYINIGALIQVPFSILSVNGPSKLPCTFWILLFHIFICIVGLVVFVTAVKKYRKRKREDNYNCQKVIEETYERQLNNMILDKLSSSYEIYDIEDVM